MAGTSATTMMALSSATQGVGSLASAYTQSRALEMQGDFQKRQYETNAKMAELQAEDAIKRGDKAATQHKKQTKRLIGSQRAALAAQGIEVDSGSALDIQTDTAAMGAEDAMTIKNNAWREAWGFRAEALNMRGQGAFAQMAARNQASNTLLTGGMQAVGYGLQGYGQYQSGKAPAKKGK